MKMILAIVSDEDGPKVMNELNRRNFGVTKLGSTGGFLRVGNTTLLLGVEEEKVPEAIDVIESKSKGRKQMVNSSIMPNGGGGVYMPYPVEVVVGGATIFVLNIEQYEKV